LAKILNIETSTRVCSVTLSVDGIVKAIKESHVKNAHAGSVTLFSEEVIKSAGFSFTNLDAIAVSKGPGSYTGLRIGVSTAKGFCYSLEKPLIAISTLKAMVFGMIKKMGETADNYVFCPMIDARRMEVYTAVYDHKLVEIQEIRAEIIDEHSFTELLEKQKVVFAGDGAEKCKPILGQNKNALFLNEFYPSSSFLCELAEEKFKKGLFEDVAYFEPFYLKDFVAGIPKVKGLKS